MTGIIKNNEGRSSGLKVAAAAGVDGVNWQTGSIKTGTFTATAGEGYFANTSGGAFTMNLPAASVGDIVAVVDYTNTFQTNALTISPNGSQKIGGTSANASLSTEGQSVIFIYVDDTEGWKNIQDSTSNVKGQNFICASGGNSVATVCTNFKVHTFTSPGTFTVNSGSGALAVVDYTVVAGGGGGGGKARSGGGGGGGFRESKVAATSGCWSASPLAATTSLPVIAQGYPITVGAGGAGQPGSADNSAGTRGANSIFSSITSTGGGAGRDDDSPLPGNPPGPGGSGGGSGGGANAANLAGADNTPPVSPPQGEPGGAATSPDGAGNQGSGGGGATQVGFNNQCAPNSGKGGAGATNSITGSSVARAGGGGASSVPGRSAGPGGTGGGGAGGSPTPGTAGTTNTGGGGGGSGGSGAGATGGSGIVIIRYKFQ